MTINLFRGHPSNDLLPSREILIAAESVLGQESRPGDTEDDTRHPLTYGSDQGALEVREQICEWVASMRNDTVIDANCINLTNGASFGAATALNRCCPREYTIEAYAVTPTYYLINQIFKDAGFEGRTSGIVESDCGMDLNSLKKALESNDARLSDSIDQRRERISKTTFRYILYLVPVFSNPRGYTLSRDENEALLKLARKHDVLILCDQVYDYLHYDANYRLPQTLIQLDRDTLVPGSVGNVIANCSFSKYLGPGLRVGWQECASPILAQDLSQTGANKSGGSPSHLNSFIVKELLASGLATNVLQRLRDVYRERAQSYYEAMVKFLPPGTKILGGQGGYFFWLTFPPEYDVQRITAECKAQGVILAPGQFFEVIGDEKGWGLRCFRVSVSYHDSAEAVQAIRIWGEVARTSQATHI